MRAEFRPARGLANGHVQSILASSALRRVLVRRPLPAFVDDARREVIETPEGVRLETWINEHPAPRAVALLFHGWEGHANASYLLETGVRLFRAGFTVIRLNFRDHGETHDLNEGLFHSVRIAEVVDATEILAARHAPLPFCVGGYSLGGNFALRVALRARARLCHVAAVSPVIDPSVALVAIESALPLYHAYFMKKWRRSLRRKHELFPDRYDDVSKLPLRLRALTAWMVERYTSFPSLEAYLDGYTIGGDRLGGITVPAHIITAADDPVIPIDEFHHLELPPNVQRVLQPKGGHCGFIENWRLESWAARYLTELFTAAVASTKEPSTYGTKSC